LFGVAAAEGLQNTWIGIVGLRDLTNQVEAGHNCSESGCLDLTSAKEAHNCSQNHPAVTREASWRKPHNCSHLPSWPWLQPNICC